MKEPPRLLDETLDASEAELLRFARNEGPSNEAASKIVAAVMAGAAVSTATSALAASTAEAGASAKGSLGALSKWMLLAGAAIGVPLTAWVLAGLSGRAPEPAQPNPVVLERRAENTPRVEASSVPPAAGADAPSRDGTGARPSARSKAVAARSSAVASAVPAADSLAEEVAWLGRAKRALLSRDAGSASRALEEYQRRFPRGRLKQEATLVRLEALAQEGQSSAVLALGERFLTQNPSSPYAARVRALTAEARRQSSTR